MGQLPAKKAFDKQNQGGTKTYALVELVKGAPTQMVDRGPDNTVFAFPVVALLELLLLLGVVAVLLGMSIAINAPLEEIANPGLTTDPAKAPWYFMGLQEMQEHGHPLVMGVLLPALMILFLLAIPYVDASREGAGRWFTSARGRRVALSFALYALVAMPLFILLDSAFPPRELLRGLLPNVVTQSLIPLAVLAIIVLLPLLVLWRSKPTPREVVLALFTLLLVSALVFTLTGFLFRGPGFHLYWPWAMPNGYNPFNNL
ncbi:MAG: hypothetical protein D6768_02440 [Chloroflexi bacterium]|nr:MAG: hypothetical protein D6768_02440 [Chloroflexota bacterium]